MNNTSTTQVLYQPVGITQGTLLKFFIVTLLSVFFISLNAIMVCSLWSKAVFKERPRYILFTHMLVNDSIQLLFTYILFIHRSWTLWIMTYACAFLIFVSNTTFTHAPLNLAAMSLERYVAICFPLRHAQIATPKRTYAAIGTMELISSINFLLDILSVAATKPTYLSDYRICNREQFFLNPWQVNALHGFNILYFVSVTIIIIFCYVSIMIAARSFSSNKEPATKAHRTVLLHMIQLGLCSTSFLYLNIEQAAAKAGNSILSAQTLRELLYVTYLFVLLLPRCLSPLIYGLRDDAVRQIFMRYLCFGRRKRDNVISTH